ncbi:MAG: PKD domain-containing protein, partial [Deltaproteobacteria bacterium]|nr:PKD domain-containing protein [Deltaproteobacteria bacterium]
MEFDRKSPVDRVLGLRGWFALLACLSLLLLVNSCGTDSGGSGDDNTPPVADAGEDQTVFVNETVMLDATASTDVDGDFLTYDWLLTQRPAGSGAVLSDRDALMPTFRVDRPGSYRVELIVSDGERDSDPDTIEINTLNSGPVADAGMDQTVLVGELVRLDGSDSFDVDLDPLSYRWTFAGIASG